MTNAQKFSGRGKTRGEGSGSVRQRTAGSWEGRYRANGERHTVYGKNRSEAEAKVREGLEKTRQGLDPKGGKETLNHHIIKDYLPLLARSVQKERTYKGHEQLLRTHVQPTLGNKTLEELFRKPRLIDQLYADLYTRRANNTVVHVHVSLHKCLRQAVLWGKLPSNPADKVLKPKLERAKQHPLDTEETARLLSFDHPLRAFWTLAVLHGFRRGELMALCWSEVQGLDDPTPKVSVVATLEVGVKTPANTRKGIEAKPYKLGDPKTDKSRRSVMLCSRAAAALQQHRARLDTLPLPRAFVFDRGDGLPFTPEQMRDAWHQTRKALRLPAATTIHDLRHTAATTLLHQNVNAKIVSEMLGHASIAITLDVYSHVLPSIQAQAVEALDGLFSEKAA